MKLREALDSQGIPWPKHGKMRCPVHVEKSASMQLYEKTNSWTCFGCGANGDGFGLLAALQGRPVADVLRERKGTIPKVAPARTYMLEERLEVEFVEVTQVMFWAIWDQGGEWELPLLKVASLWLDQWHEHMRDLPPYKREYWVTKTLPRLVSDWLIAYQVSPTPRLVQGDDLQQSAVASAVRDDGGSC